MIYKLCARCGKKVLHPDRYCKECADIVAKSNKNRYRDYNKKRYEDKEEQKYVRFYSSSNWINQRDSIKSRDMGLCLPCFYSLCHSGKAIYKEDSTCASDYIHHIAELREDYNSRLDSNNLISVCSHHHNVIHKEYDKGIKEKELMQKELRKILDWFITTFYKKQLDN